MGPLIVCEDWVVTEDGANELTSIEQFNSLGSVVGKNFVEAFDGITLECAFIVIMSD